MRPFALCLTALPFAASALLAFAQEAATLTTAPDARHAQAAAPDAARATGKVHFYATEWCPYCKQARAYMQRKNVDFIEKDIEKDPAYHAEYIRLGGRGVPFFVMGEETMSGFTPAAFDRMYAAFRGGAQPANKPLPRRQSADAAMKAGDALVGKIPGVYVYTSERARKHDIVRNLANSDAVTYTGEQHKGMIKTKMAGGEGWAIKYYMQQQR